MAYSNYLLFNNVFLKNLQPSPEELAEANYLVHESARDWYKADNFTSPNKIADAWIRPLLNQQSLVLVPTKLDEQAWYLAAPWDQDAPLAICYVIPDETDLSGFNHEGLLPKGQHWMIKGVNLVNRSDHSHLRWVVLTNGTKWRLLDAKALRRYEAYLEVDLLSLLQGEEDPLAAYLFYRLFRLEDSFELDEATGQSRLESFLEQSDTATEETEDYLKITVSDYLDMPGGGDGILGQLCMGLVNAIDPGGTKKFTDEERADVYRDATYLLYRLLFILYAEARNLLPMDREDYRKVSLERIIDEARGLRANPQRVDRISKSLWKQLQTLFDAIYYSDEYLGIPAYNGGLFENHNRPYLQSVELANAYLAEALYQLAYMPDPKGKNNPERIDYCDLSVRHLGSLYEGMIEYQLFIAEEDLIARQGKGSTVRYLASKTNKLKPADEIVKQGKVYFAQSPSERKATGTHYTPEELVSPLVEQTLGRILQQRWANFEDELTLMLNELRNATSEETQTRLKGFIDDQINMFIQDQILSLRLCDPAMGSGHFLVHIAHTLTNFILQTLTLTDWENPSINLDPNYWRRRATETCLFGIDINEMAVELAKLSLWLVTMELGRPLSFLNHHLHPGNTLLGIRLNEVIQFLEDDSAMLHQKQVIAAKERGQLALWEPPQPSDVFEKINEHLDRISEQIVAKVEDVEEQESEYKVVQEITAPYKAVADLLIARSLGLKIRDREMRSIALALISNMPEMMSNEEQEIYNKANDLLSDRTTVHWELEFPRVFINSGRDLQRQTTGFDAIVGNPPFLGGSKISSELGGRFLTYLKNMFPKSAKNTDLAAYFFSTAYDLLKPTGAYLGFVATNTIGQGDTRETGLGDLVEHGGQIVSAHRFLKWPGDASVEVNLVVISNRSDHSFGGIWLDGQQVDYISSYLDDLPDAEIVELAQNSNKCFLGDNVAGIGFVITDDEAERLLLDNKKNVDCVFPFLNGSDINNNPLSKPSRSAICFHDWPLLKAKEYADLLQIVIDRVKPIRQNSNRATHKRKWWLYGDYRQSLREAISNLDRVLVRSRVSETHALAFVSSSYVFSDATVVFAFSDFFSFSVLQSQIHEVWLRRQASSLRTDVRYTPTDCFRTFPFPQNVADSAKLQSEIFGKKYYDSRREALTQRGLGLTSFYNMYHSPRYSDVDISEIREIHRKMDSSVLTCYGWEDIELDHGFYENDRGKTRYMPTREAQRKIFTRLLELNDEIAKREIEGSRPSNADHTNGQIDDLED